jgi:hypothetical protein
MLSLVLIIFAKETLVNLPNLGQTPKSSRRLKWFSCVFSKFHYRSSKPANMKVVPYFREHIFRNWWTFNFECN